MTVVDYEERTLIQWAQGVLWKSRFWGELFFNVLKRHSYEEEFYLVGEYPTKKIVDNFLHQHLKSLQSKYKITCRRETQKDSVELSLGLTRTTFRSKRKRGYFCDEIKIIITHNNILLELLPYSTFEKEFPLLDYLIVQNILDDFCKTFFDNPDQSYVEFLDFCKKIQHSKKTLTHKTRQIAQSSIESIYFTSAEKQKEINHGFLYSNIKIDGKDDIVIYQDFLNNPQDFINKLKKRERILS